MYMKFILYIHIIVIYIETYFHCFTIVGFYSRENNVLISDRLLVKMATLCLFILFKEIISFFF